MKQYRIKKSNVTVWAFTFEDAIEQLENQGIHAIAKESLEVIYDSRAGIDKIKD